MGKLAKFCGSKDRGVGVPIGGGGAGFRARARRGTWVLARAGVARLRTGSAHLGPALKRVLLKSGGPSGQASCGCPGQPALPAPCIVQTPGAGGGAFGVLSDAPLGAWGFVDAQAAEAAEGCVKEESAGSGAQRASEAQSGRSCWHSH